MRPLSSPAGLTFAEVLLAALIMGLCLPMILSLTTGQEREVRWSSHNVDVASIAHGRLGDLEGRLAARGYPRQPERTERRFDLASGDHAITVRENTRVEPLADQPGVFLLELTYTWTEPYAGSQADRTYRTSLLCVDPELGLRDPPGGKS